MEGGFTCFWPMGDAVGCCWDVVGREWVGLGGYLNVYVPRYVERYFGNVYASKTYDEILR